MAALTPGANAPNGWFWNDTKAPNELLFTAQATFLPERVGLRAGNLYKLIARHRVSLCHGEASLAGISHRSFARHSRHFLCRASSSVAAFRGARDGIPHRPSDAGGEPARDQRNECVFCVTEAILPPPRLDPDRCDIAPHEWRRASGTARTRNPRDHQSAQAPLR